MKPLDKIMERGSRYHALCFKSTLVSGVVLLCLSGAALANPTGGTVAGGSAQITSSGNKETITQTTNQAIINWQTFNIAPNEWTQFVQPSSSSVTLNRVAAGNPSVILGQLTANGQIFLINPNGVFFGKNATVNVGGLVVSASDISNANFMNGVYSFNQASPNLTARIINNGTITAGTGGLVAFVAPGVENQGLIQANLGKIALGSGSTWTLDLYGDNLINFDVGSTNPGLSQLIQSGTLSAQGGTVLLTAQAAENVLNSEINMTGIIDASSSIAKGGVIEFVAPLSQVNITGQMNTSGVTGGGTVSVTAQNITLSPTTVIKANSTGTGNGGNVSLVASNTTTVAGTISAQAGTGGKGGVVDTSGTTVNINNALVKAGQWLLDPIDFVIDASNNQAIENNLNAGTNVTIATAASGSPTTSPTVNNGSSPASNGDIDVDAPVSWTTAALFDLSSYGNIFVNEAITNSGGGHLVLQADNTGTGNGTVTFNPANMVTYVGGAMNGGGSVTFNNGGLVEIYYNPSLPGGSLPANAIPYDYPTPYTVSTAPGGTAPTVYAYMLVNNANELQSIGNGADPALELAGDYALGRNIDMSTSGPGGTPFQYTYTGLVNSLEYTLTGFMPIGLSTQNDGSLAVSPFTGVFNGNGNAISNLVINLQANTDGNGNPTFYGENSLDGDGVSGVGLFAVVSGVNGGGILENLNLANVNISTNITTTPLNIVPNSGVGALAGVMENSATLSNVQITNPNSSIFVTELTQGGMVSPTPAIGGLVGLFTTGSQGNGTLSNAASISVQEEGPQVLGADYVGGLFGFVNNANFTAGSATNSGNVTSLNDAGGIAAVFNGSTMLFSSISNSGAIASPQITGGLFGVLETVFSGGLVGGIGASNQTNIIGTMGGTATNSGPLIAAGEIGGGLFGQMDNTTVNSSVLNTAPLIGFSVMGGIAGIVGEYSTLDTFNASLTNEGPLSSGSSPGNLQEVGGLVGHAYSIAVFGDMTNTSTGTITISGAALPGIGGLFGAIGGSTTAGVDNVLYGNMLNSAAIYAPQTSFVGGLIGEMMGPGVQAGGGGGGGPGIAGPGPGGFGGGGAPSTLPLVIGNPGNTAFNTGNITGLNYVGGLFGNFTFVTMNSVGYNSGNVSGNNEVGGITGAIIDATGASQWFVSNQATITGNNQVGGLAGAIIPLSSTAISSTTSDLSDSISWASVQGNDYVGGAVGFNGGTINNVYSIGAVNADQTVGAPVGSLIGADLGTINLDESATLAVLLNNNVPQTSASLAGTVNNSYWDSTNTFLTSAQIATQPLVGIGVSNPGAENNVTGNLIALSNTAWNTGATAQFSIASESNWNFLNAPITWGINVSGSELNAIPSGHETLPYLEWCSSGSPSCVLPLPTGSRLGGSGGFQSSGSGSGSDGDNGSNSSANDATTQTASTTVNSAFSSALVTTDNSVAVIADDGTNSGVVTTNVWTNTNTNGGTGSYVSVSGGDNTSGGSAHTGGYGCSPSGNLTTGVVSSTTGCVPTTE